METDWSVAAGADDPVIETDWADAATGRRWVDLRVAEEIQQQRIAALTESAATPAMADALAQLNAPDGALMTTKCDRWPLDADERSELADALDMPLASFGWGSYIDVLMAHPVPMADFLLHEEWARMAALRSAALEQPEARLELVVRPAHREGVWGYGLTVYHYAAGDNAQRADGSWAAAVEQTVPILIAAAEAMMMPADEANS